MGFEYQDLGETINAQPENGYGVVRPEHTEFTFRPMRPDKVSAVLKEAAKGHSFGQLRKIFGSASKAPTWLLCLAREQYLKANPPARKSRGHSMLIDENQPSCIVPRVAAALGLPVKHIDPHEKMKGADDLQVVNCAMASGHSMILTADWKDPRGGANRPHLTKVVRDMARTLARADLLRGEEPRLFHTLPMVVRVPPPTFRQKGAEEVVKLIADRRAEIIRHAKQRRTLVLSFTNANGPARVITHGDVIEEAMCILEQERQGRAPARHVNPFLKDQLAYV